MRMFASIRVNRLFFSVFAAAAVAAFAAMCCTAAAVSVQDLQNKQGVKLPIIMYHSMLKEQKRLGKYVVSPDTFENDVRYLQKKGYTSITVQDLIDYVYEKKPLPKKPVMLTFDDGYYNNYAYAFPIIKKYGVKIVISPIGYYTDLFSDGDADHPNYSHLTWSEILEMKNSGLVEFQNHSYNLHASKRRIGATKLKKESTASYEAVLQLDVGKMQDEMFEKTGYRPTAFVYPYGAVSRESIPILKKMGFLATMTCQEKTNVVTPDPECLYGLGRYLRPSRISSGAYFHKIGAD